jgi:hypothetical protein
MKVTKLQGDRASAKYSGGGEAAGAAAFFATGTNGMTGAGAATQSKEIPPPGSKARDHAPPSGPGRGV